MATIVVPFRAGGKSRLPAGLREELALAMLRDVLGAAVGNGGAVSLVTDDTAAHSLGRNLGVEILADPGGGQGAAVEAALVGVGGACCVVNADLPCVTADALARLAEAGPAYVAAPDGTTNALSLPDATWFAPLYGPGSAARFEAAGLERVLIPELEHDVDMLSDLEALSLPAGRWTTFVLDQHKAPAARAG